MKKQKAIALVGAPVWLLVIYGSIKFPDAPIAPCRTQEYCGKHGELHSEEEYQQYKTWSESFAVLIPLGLVIGVIVYRKKNA